MLRFAVEQSSKHVSSDELVAPQEMTVPIDKLRELFGIQDLPLNNF